MKRRLLFLWLLTGIATGAIAQTNNNGELDQISELTTTVEIPITMPDGIKLMTNITVPVTSDAMTADIDFGSGTPSNVELIPSGLPLICYDNVNGAPNPNPQQLPLILTRTPYNKSVDDTNVLIALLGYAYAMQDMRGRYASDGVYLPMYSDAWSKTPYHSYQHILDVTSPTDPATANAHEDGYHSVQYLANQLNNDFDYNNDGTSDPLFNGSIGMFGASALGNTQYQAAAAHKIDPNGPGLKSLLPIVATNEHYLTTGFKNGVYRQSLVSEWLKGQLRDMDDVIGTDNALQNNQHTPFDYSQTNETAVIELGTDHFTTLNYGNSVAAAYPNFPGRGDMDASFAPVDAAGEGDASGTNNRYTNMEVPAYHLTGWWDIFVDGQITTWENMREHTSVGGPAKETQKIIIGPWAHQTIGSATTGDVTYNSNVKDIIGIDFDTVDFNNVDVPSFLNSELITWLRYTLNQNGYKNIGEPKYLIPQSNNYQPVSGPFGLTAYARVPAEDFTFTLEELLNYLSGEGSLGDVAYSVHASPGGTVVFSGTYPIEPLNPPLITSTGGAAGAIQVPDFANDVPDFRGYVVGPVGDGVPANANVGNYWLSGDEFPLTSNIACTEMFLHQDGSLDGSIPTADEGSLGYMHDPENPARTIGGANMIPSVPGPSGRTSQGQIDLADPALRPYGLDHPGVIAFETAVLTDTVSIVGFPEARLFASSAPRGVAAGAPTSTDFMVTIVDVYPDGRELFVVEGAVNARARDYARTLLADNEDINAPFTNINSGDVYEYNFRLLPIAYTFGKDHKIKVLISSASYPRYQSNPNLPLEAGEFFRWEPGGTNTYNFQGANMSPRIADNTLHFSDTQPSSIILPVFTEQVNAQVKVFLQGALGGTFMGTALNGAGIVPNIQPYNVAPYNYAGSENLSIIPPNVVDWVLLELREDTPDMDVVARKAALLRNDGTVVDVKGSTNISFDHVPAGQYHLSVRHRNHLGIMTKASLSFN